MNAQKLFGIEITVYTQLNFVEKQMQQLTQLFDLYLYHKSKESNWSRLLWNDLDIAALEKGCDDSLQKLEKLPEELKSLHTYRKVSECVYGFKESLPLISSLKTDALRDRHWKELMDLTGVVFDTHSTSFTLGKLFEMQLHKHSEKICMFFLFVLVGFSLLVCYILYVLSMHCLPHT